MRKAILTWKRERSYRHRLSEAKTALRFNEQDLNDRMEEMVDLERS
ncbi:7269_t:CDS:2 [Funneliformis caledonium]|uniref:7269_t:CDS:1 n=1 Tax=Funneliformis caledonium TaxID=1117310 RepID=A0A9N9GZ89_9GLOM|nr:7269_t:CDS:2 [Funneliformis caledonium]